MFFPFSDDVPTRRVPVVTVGIIAVNALLFLWLARLPPAVQETVVARHGFVPRRVGQFFDPELTVEVQLRPARIVRQWPLGDVVVPGAAVRLPPDRGEILLSLLTTMFLHGGLAHILGNMWFLWIFGNNVEDRLGHIPFLAFYFSGGLVASACHWLTDPNSAVPVVGASGAVSAVLGAYAVAYPFARIRCLVFLVIIITTVDIPAFLWLGIWFVEQLLEALGTLRLGMSGGVAWWAHVGGFVAGVLFMAAQQSPGTTSAARSVPLPGVRRPDPFDDGDWL